MAKRFIDTSFFIDPWVRRLSPQSKLVFLYLVCSCDLSGVWEPDHEQAEFCIGEKIDWERVAVELQDQSQAPKLFDTDAEAEPRLKILENGRWLLLGFIDFQYGHLSPDCKPHQKVMELMDKHSLSKHLSKTSDTLLDKDKDKYKDKEKEEKTEYNKDFLVFWNLYPVKQAKEAAYRKFLQVRKKVPMEKLLDGVRNYNSWIAATGTEFIKHASTWLNKGCWEDVLQFPKGHVEKPDTAAIIKKLKEGGAIKDAAYNFLPGEWKKRCEADSRDNGTFWTLKTEREK